MPVPQPDRAVADAIERVLEAEQAAAATITAVETEARASLEAARESRRRLLERARLRITQLHERAEARLADRLAQLDAATAAEALDATGLRVVADEALRAVAARLTTASAP